MKKLFVIIAAFVTLFSLEAQTKLPQIDINAALAADAKLSYGNDYPYRFQMTKLTESPVGYTPFYISHYGRHGSRYYWSNNLYCTLDTLLTYGHENHILTEAGEKFYQNFESALPELKTGWGELTDVGWNQHQQIARTMYERFPEVFTDGGDVYAICSLSGRCVMSMAAFCLELKECNPNLNIREQSSRFTLHGVVPTDKENPDWKKFDRKFPRFMKKNHNFYGTDSVFVEKIFNRIFTSKDGLKKSPSRIVSYLKDLYTSLPSIGHEGMMCGIYTDEDVVSQWEQTNLGSYAWVFGPQMETLPILQDILQQADDVISGKVKKVASLRFGHDTCIGPLTVLMGINGADLDPEDPADVKYCYQNWETCKASNMQLIFYHNPSDANADILVKCLLNGSEATLPLPTDNFPYYKWSDFKDFYSKK